MREDAPRSLPRGERRDDVFGAVEPMKMHDGAIGAAISTSPPGHYGTPEHAVVLAPVNIAAAWNAQGDPANATFAEAVQRLFDITLPIEPNSVSRSDTLTSFWIGPTSWLLAAGGASSLVDFKAKRDAINRGRGALFDLSASRIAYIIAGPRALDVLAAYCPLDFHRRAFPAGTCAQSLLGHVNALFYRPSEESVFTIMVAPSFAADVWHALKETSAQYGYDVEAARPFG